MFFVNLSNLQNANIKPEKLRYSSNATVRIYKRLHDKPF